MQYLINSEIYPLGLRALGGSISMTFHFANQYGNSKAVPTMFVDLTTGGTMFFFSAITLLGLAWVWFFLPELSGKSLEAVDAIFELPWYTIGRKGKALTVGVGSGVENVTGEKANMEMFEEVQEVGKAEGR
nr:quinate permease [Quercus suber]